ncbi:MAG: hypothetical protein GVY26_06390 [Bacteroidetes bacterium]|jgi:hypothetical protein|nr:hypothetical protein [Bacteroidota bacterium]
MMKYCFGLLLFALPLLAAAQSADETAIQERLQAYYEANEAEDWESVVDMLYPPLVEMASRDALVQMFTDLEGNGMVFEMNDFATEAISTVFEHDGQRYAEVEYRSGLSLQFTSEAYKSDEMTEMLQANFEREYGADNVEHDSDTNTFNIQAEKVMLAIQQETEGSPWTFMELDAANPLNEQLIPAAVRNHFNASE